MLKRPISDQADNQGQRLFFDPDNVVKPGAQQGKYAAGIGPGNLDVVDFFPGVNRSDIRIIQQWRHLDRESGLLK
jgi:hypothetical protein